MININENAKLVEKMKQKNLTLTHSEVWDESRARECIAVWTRLLRLDVLSSHPPHTVLFTQGTEPLETVLLVRGLVKLTHLLPNGRETILGLRFPGELIGRNAALLQSPHRVSASTVIWSEVCHIPAERLRRNIESNREAALFLIKDQALDYHEASKVLLDQKMQPARDRLLTVLRRLLAMASQIGPRTPIRLKAYLTDCEMAALIAVSPEHFSRLKAQLMAEGLYPPHKEQSRTAP